MQASYCAFACDTNFCTVDGDTTPRLGQPSDPTHWISPPPLSIDRQTNAPSYITVGEDQWYRYKYLYLALYCFKQAISTSAISE